MDGLNIKVQISQAELERAVSFVCGPDVSASEVVDTYFMQDINIDFSAIESEEAKTFHRSGLIAVLINLINTPKI